MFALMACGSILLRELQVQVSLIEICLKSKSWQQIFKIFLSELLLLNALTNFYNIRWVQMVSYAWVRKKRLVNDTFDEQLFKIFRWLCSKTRLPQQHQHLKEKWQLAKWRLLSRWPGFWSFRLALHKLTVLEYFCDILNVKVSPRLVEGSTQVEEADTAVAKAQVLVLSMHTVLMMHKYCIWSWYCQNSLWRRLSCMERRSLTSTIGSSWLRREGISNQP